MKFGKDLEQYKSPGWEDNYLDYKGLKIILKKLEDGASREEVDAEFFQALEEDLEKVCRQTSGLTPAHRHMMPSLTATQVNRAFLERCQEVEEALEKASSSGRAYSGSGEKPVGEEAELVAHDPQAKAALQREQVIKQQEAERQFFDSYRTLGRLQTFVWINTKGFQKIMKKYDKRQQLRGTGNELGPDFEKRLEKEAFCSGKLEVRHSP